MAELTYTCPCGAVLKAPDEDRMVKAVREHVKTIHDMELSKGEAREKVKQAKE